jgi:hypothetical protein
MTQISGAGIHGAPARKEPLRQRLCWRAEFLPPAYKTRKNPSLLRLIQIEHIHKFKFGAVIFALEALAKSLKGRERFFQAFKQFVDMLITARFLRKEGDDGLNH